MNCSECTGGCCRTSQDSNCQGGCSSNKEERKTYRSDKEKANLEKRLNIIEGQIRGINQMIQDDRYCDDVLIQIAAVSNSLKSLGNKILENHLNTCVAYDIQMGNLEILEDVMLLIKKLQ